MNILRFVDFGRAIRPVSRSLRNFRSSSPCCEAINANFMSAMSARHRSTRVCSAMTPDLELSTKSAITLVPRKENTDTDG